MNSRHAHRTGVSVRLDPDDRRAAKDALDQYGWEMAEFVLTCLAAVARDPGLVLRIVEPHRVKRPKGRPPKTPDE